MATLYFNGAVDGDWNNLSNWWDDSGFTTPASALPTSSDSVVASATISSNGGSAPTVVNFTINGSNQYLGITLTVTGIATFNDTTYNVGNITGEVEFNDSSANGQLGSIIGNVTFNDNSIHALGANINGNATFNNSSIKRGSRGSVTGIITWNSSYPSDGSLTYYFNGATDGDWNNIGNWWLDSGFSVPVTSTLIGLPQTIDSVIASANITSNSGSTPTVKNLNVGNSTYTNVYFDISINVENSATFNNGAKFAYNGNRNLLLNENKTVTFNSNSDCYGTIDSIDPTSLVNIVFNNCGNIGAAFDPYGQLSGNLTLNDSSMTIGTYTIGYRGVLTLNGYSGFFSHFVSSGVLLNNKTVILNDDGLLGFNSGMINYCNVTFNNIASMYAYTDFTNCTLTFNDKTVYRGLGLDSEIYYNANNIYYFNDNSFNYGFIATTVNGITSGNSTVNINLAKGINGSSILGIV